MVELVDVVIDWVVDVEVEVLWVVELLELVVVLLVLVDWVVEVELEVVVDEVLVL